MSNINNRLTKLENMTDPDKFRVVYNNGTVTLYYGDKFIRTLKTSLWEAI